MKKETNKEIEKIIEEFIKRFANPTAKYLGNDFNTYPKANIKDATDFLRTSFLSYHNTILEEVKNEIEKIGVSYSGKVFPIGFWNEVREFLTPKV